MFNFDEQLDKAFKNSGRNFVNFLSPGDYNVEWFKTNNGTYIIDLIPFTIKTDNHPKYKKGTITYNLDVWTHSKIGVKEGSYVCLAETYNKPCPICEFYRILRNEAKTEVEKKKAEEFRPIRRAVYNILDHQDGKVKIFSVSYNLFEKKWLGTRNAVPGKISPVYSKNGHSIKFTDTGARGIGQFEYFFFLPIQDYDENILSQTVPLDDMLNIVEYEELKEILENGVSNMDQETIEPEIEMPDYLKDVGEELEESKEVEKEEIESKKRKRKRVKCPFNHTLGKDFENYDDCDDCSVFEVCEALFDSLEEGEEDD